MDNKEVNERMLEVSRELEEMRFNWVQIYHMIMDLITMTDEERED